jgi:hypothetical protein
MYISEHTSLRQPLPSTASPLPLERLGFLGDLTDDLKRYIQNKGRADVETFIEEQRQKHQRTLVIISENHSAETRSVDLVRRLMKNSRYRFIASEYFLNAGVLRQEIRNFLRRTRAKLGRLLCPYQPLLEDLKRQPRYILFVGSRREGTNVRDRSLAHHFLAEHRDRQLRRTTPGILVCGINHGSRVEQPGQRKTTRSWLTEAGFKSLGARLVTDDLDRGFLRHNIQFRTDRVWPVGEKHTQANAIHLLDLVKTTSEYTVVPTNNSPFERITDDLNDPSSISMADRYELVVLAKRLPRPCPR